MDSSIQMSKPDITKPESRFTAPMWTVAAIAAAGLALQIAGGAFNIAVLARPVNLWAGGAIVLACVAAGFNPGSRAVRWLTGVPLAVCLISALCALSLIMGLTPQGAAPAGGMAEVSARLGFNEMTSSWPFVLLYLTLTVALGALVARRLAAFRFADRGFYLNHIGLLLVLFAAGFGYADIERYMVRVDEGATVQMGYDPATGHPTGLPVAVTLHDFEMEVYPSEVPGERPQPRRFASTITVASPDGRKASGTAEVNHPLRFDGWMVYQSGYDSEAGPESTYSVFELVRDPWLWVVYVGFAMVAAGAVAMIWKGRRRYGLE